MQHRVWFAFLTGITLTCAIHGQPRTPPVTGIFIPVVINLYQNSGVTESEAREAVARANGILNQADFRLVPVKVNSITRDSGGEGEFGGDNGDGGGAPGDSRFTEDERDEIRTFGGKELRKLTNGRGIKISFGMTPSAENSDWLGLSVHRNPTIIVKERETPALTGSTIAHEVAHVLTLSVRHTIQGTTSSDDDGHAPAQAGPAGNGNLMAPAGRRTGTTLTPDQIREMKRAQGFGKCSNQFNLRFPGAKCEIEFGAVTDDLRDQTGNSVPPPFYDLHHAVLQSFHRTARGGDTRNINAQIMVAGVLPVGEEIDLMVALAFDTDSKPRTGIRYAGVRGIDRIVYTTVTGGRELVLKGFVLNPSTKRTTPLPAMPVAETEHEHGDTRATPVATSFLLDIPKTLVRVSAATPNVVAVSGRIGAIADPSDDRIFDATSPFLYDTLRFRKDPTLRTFGNGVPTAGRPYRFEVTGLRARDPLTVFLDESVVFEGRLNAAGALTGNFVFPRDLSTREFHFLTAQDGTGEFAYSITCPEEERRRE